MIELQQAYPRVSNVCFLAQDQTVPVLAAHSIEVEGSNLYSVGGDQHNYVTYNLHSSSDLGGLLQTILRLHVGFRNDPTVVDQLERQTIASWISSLHFKLSHNEIIQQRQDGTGRWLLESKEFKAWRDGTSEMLWCPGDRELILRDRIWLSLTLSSWYRKDYPRVRMSASSCLMRC